MDDIDNLILETISFFDPMTKEMIILDFDNRDLQNFNHFNIEILEERLEVLTKKKLIKRFKEGKETVYQRIMPKKSLLKKIARFLIIK